METVSAAAGWTAEDDVLLKKAVEAVIKMDNSGSFYIKNIGKCSIFVNSKEVPCNKRISLISDSLLEIRNMKFIFHVNHDAVKQYIARLEVEAPKARSQHLIGIRTHKLKL